MWSLSQNYTLSSVSPFAGEHVFFGVYIIVILLFPTAKIEDKSMVQLNIQNMTIT